MDNKQLFRRLKKIQEEMDGNDLYRDMNEEEIIKSIILPVLSDLD